jgi:hypothetical protein
MVTVLEYTAFYDEVNGAKGAIDTNNILDPEKGWVRTFNNGSRRSILVGQQEGEIIKLRACITEALSAYFKEKFEPMPEEIFYGTVKAMLCFARTGFEERGSGRDRTMWLTEEAGDLL